MSRTKFFHPGILLLTLLLCAAMLSGCVAIEDANHMPLQFDAKLHALTFLIMLGNLGFLLIFRKWIIAGRLTFILIWLLLNSTLLFALHWAIAGVGFGFVMHYDAAHDLSFWGRVGTNTWLTVTPPLYFILIGLCVNTYVKMPDKDDSE
ncbi:MAG: hypothetical protein PHV18_04640 [Lachnospiraceae bacterium]|nr:hypothetical protein [Lachnospiraceae bacterium]